VSLARALREAAATGLRVELDDLGALHRHALFAEYDPARARIAVNARVVAALRARCGDEFARRFVAFAIWHELQHHGAVTRDEGAAHAYAAARSGERAATFEVALQALLA
jgi:hypothetical protein